MYKRAMKVCDLLLDSTRLYTRGVIRDLNLYGGTLSNVIVCIGKAVKLGLVRWKPSHANDLISSKVKFLFLRFHAGRLAKSHPQKPS